MPNKLMTHKFKINSSIPIRKEYIDDSLYTVVPVIMMKEGVLSGSGGPILYTSNELSKHFQAWNGVPVCLNHPEIDGTPVSCNHPEFYGSMVLGTIFNTTFEDNALKAEAWLEDKKVNKIAPDLIKSLEKGEAIDVSTGLFNDDIQTQGAWEGTKYHSVASNIKPDHLALLPGSVGACSWKDGCGIRANEEKKGGESNIMLMDKIMAFFRKSLPPGIVDNEMSHSETRKNLQELIDPLTSDDEMSYIVDVYEDKFIYEVWSMESGEEKLYKQKYTKDSDDVVELKDDPVRVKRKINYETFSADEVKTEDVVNNEGEEEMSCCPDKVAAFISNEANPYTSDDAEWMNQLTEPALEGLMKAFPEKTETPKINEGEEETVKMTTMEEVLANSDGEAKEAIEFSMRVHSQKKAEFIEKIKANESNKFTDEELDSFKIDFLEKLAGMTPAVTNFAANTGSVAPTSVGSDEIEPMEDVYANEGGND